MKTILVPVDFSDATQKVVAAAHKLATALSARIVLLHIVEPEPAFVGFEPGPISVRNSVAEDFQLTHHKLEKLKESLTGLESLALQIQGTTAAEKILHEAAAQQAVMIVMGSHGHGALYHLLAGSVTTAVLRHAACPVLVVPIRSAAAL